MIAIHHLALFPGFIGFRLSLQQFGTLLAGKASNRYTCWLLGIMLQTLLIMQTSLYSQSNFGYTRSIITAVLKSTQTCLHSWQPSIYNPDNGVRLSVTEVGGTSGNKVQCTVPYEVSQIQCRSEC